jgi:hypothetical protein
MTTTLAPATSEPAAPVAWEPCADAVWSDLDGGCCATCGWPLDEHPGRDGAPARAA